MARLAFLLLFLAGCRSAPTAPPTPLYNVQRGPVDGEPGAPSVRRFTASIDGDSLRVSAILVPPEGLPSLGEWDFQFFIGQRWTGRWDVGTAEHVVLCRQLEDVGATARTVRRTNAPSAGPGGWGVLSGMARVQTANARRIEIVVPTSSLVENQNFPPVVAVWLEFYSPGEFAQSYTRAGRTALTASTE